MPKEAEEEEAAGAPLVLRVVEGLWAVVQAVLALPLAPPEARRLRLAALQRVPRGRLRLALRAIRPALRPRVMARRWVVRRWVAV